MLVPCAGLSICCHNVEDVVALWTNVVHVKIVAGLSALLPMIRQEARIASYA